MSQNAQQTLPGEEFGTDLNRLLTAGSFDPIQVGAYLDGLDQAGRLAAMRSLSGKAQAQLFEAAKHARVLRLEDLVPASLGPGDEVPHLGINSLPIFRSFAKVFCRPAPEARELWGYNRSGGFVETVVGPGYYVTYETDDGEVLVDYTRLPSGKLEAWPEIIPNRARLSRFVYENLKDVLRGVSKHVAIGRALRNGKVADNWFALCRTKS